MIGECDYTIKIKQTSTVFICDDFCEKQTSDL